MGNDERKREEDKRYTKEGLPKVSRKTLEKFANEWMKEIQKGEITSTLDIFLTELQDYLIKTNMGYCQMIKLFTKYSSETNKNDIVAGFLFGYEILRRQGETYKLEDSAKQQ